MHNWISELDLEQLIELQTQVNDRIWAYKDGFFYHCKVRSYGRNWVENHHNTRTVQELCYNYGGDDGIVDVYTNNPDACIHNYGDVMYVPSMEDYEKWYNHQYLTRMIPILEKELKEWDQRDEVPFIDRPKFAPIYSQDDIDEYRKKLEEYDMSFTAPLAIKKCTDE